MNDSRFTYDLPEHVLAGLEASERLALEETWNSVALPPKADLDNGKERVKHSLLSQIRTQLPERAPIVSSRRTARVFQIKMQWMSAAAVVIVGLSLVFSPSPDQHRAERGGNSIKLVTLSDGSGVELTPGSRISVIEGFDGQHRRVKLHGEAFFTVTEGSTPFVVETFDSRTTVLGTSFSVRSWPGSLGASSKVVVESGRVSVSNKENRAVLLTNGQMTILSPSSSNMSDPVDIDVSNDMIWRTGGFHYDNELIGNAIDDIERRLDVNIKAPASIRLRPISYFTDDAKTAPEILGDFAATIGVRFRQISNGYELYLN